LVILVSLSNFSNSDSNSNSSNSNWFDPKLTAVLLLYHSKTCTFSSGNKDCVLYLGFDRYIGARIFDNSKQNNNATLDHGTTVTKVDGSCGVCAQLLGGNINIQGKGFRGIPRTEITISLMIKLLETKGLLHLFETIGGHSKHTDRK
jgi:hypothetical protein